ncbi:MAG: hypothetical protein M0R03_07910 [Novosphingobium sp.]|nr:hypothetical protein [Novosphingobium sp.]
MNQPINTDNMKLKRLPINRNNLFYSKESYDLELEIGKNYIEQDCNQTVILYQVDRQFTNVNSVTFEAKKDEIRFKVPVELHCVYNIESSTNEVYMKNKSGMRFKKTGNLTFSLYQQTLNELECDIKRGDYIGVQIDEQHVEYFVVEDDGKKNYSNKEYMYGYKNFWRKCIAVPIDINEFRGI